MRLILILSSICQLSNGLYVSDLYPFGAQYGDQVLQNLDQEDISSQELKLNTTVKFFSRSYQSIYVNENGMLSFLTEIPSYFNIEFPLDYPIIAIYYADVDCRASGRVLFRSTSDPMLLRRAGEELRQNFRQARSFSPTELFIATWDQVGYYEEKANKVNTFQVVLASDDSNSYVMFLYPQSGLQWIKGQGKNRNMPDARAQVGLISGEGRHFLLPGSGYDQIQKLDQWSNVNKAGIWMFQLGMLDDNEEIIEPSISSGSSLDPYSATSCDVGHLSCHGSATCQDNSEGFCCKCINGWYGDGRTCLPKGIPQRVTGKVDINVNSITVSNQELHCYVVTEDGRTYTAISKVDNKIGEDMQSLTVIGSPIAWLFALPENESSLNGFSITGGKFNYTAEIKFPRTRDVARVQMVFEGLDTFDYLKASVRVEGTIPKLNKKRKRGGRSLKVRLEDIEEKFVMVRPGMIVAQSTRSLQVADQEESLVTEVKQTIEFESVCKNQPSGLSSVLKSTRNFIVYDKKEEVARYALTSSVYTNEEDSPCKKMNCNKYSSCILDENQQPKCECHKGFTPFGRNGCADIDECSSGIHNCSPNANCINKNGHFVCTCFEGFVGNGTFCEKLITCQDLNCDSNAQCVLGSQGQAVCQCYEGYKGDGTYCQPIPTQVTFFGSSLEEEVLLDPSLYPDVVAASRDIGPYLEHTYEIANRGPRVIKKLEAQVSWPLKDSQGNLLTYLYEEPIVIITTSTGQTIKNQTCKMYDSESINPRRLPRQVGDYAGEEYGDDDYYADNIGLIVSNQEEDEVVYDQLTPEEKEIMESYDLPDYDYSHFNKYNNVQTSNPVSVSTTLERVAMDSQAKMTSISCFIDLSPGEVGRVKIPAYVFAKELKQHYETVAKFELTSMAELMITDDIILHSHPIIEVTTVLRPSQLPIPETPGKGNRCGNQVCNRYADCHFDMSMSEFSCRCVPGFNGDGVETCQRSASVQDCRQTQNCHPDAKCSFDPEEEGFICICKQGFVGNGQVCRPLHEEENCMTMNNCSPFGECKPSEYGYECTCLPGFTGDGRTCTKMNENIPKCLFGVCYCPKDSKFHGMSCKESSGPSHSLQAVPQCYGSSCACPKGYEFKDESQSCDFTYISIPAEDVHCDLPNGSQCGPNAQCIFDVSYDHSTCQCEEGFIGDGFDCELFDEAMGRSECTRNSQCLMDEKCVVVAQDGVFSFKCVRRDPSEIKGGITEVEKTTTSQPLMDLCKSSQDCHEKASCIFDTFDMRYVCKCNDFYEGDGYSFCTPGPDAGCDITFDCDSNATCQIDKNTRKHTCVCNDGYQGDGKTCEKVVIGCNIINNCAKYAKCLFNAQEGGYRCQCDASRGFDGDGFHCKSVEPCNSNPLVCDANADCVPMQGSFGCQCRQGFLGDGHSCNVIPVYDGNYIISSQGFALMKLSLDARKTGTPFYVKTYMTAAGIDVDCFKGKLYWTDTTGSAIMRANYDGSNVEVYLNAADGLQFPEGIAIDWLARNVYWADSGKRTIEVASLEAKGKKVLFEDHMKNPRGIAVDPSSSRLFWSDWERGSPRIESANLDGSDRRIFVDSHIGTPNALVIDFDFHRLCWTDAGTSQTSKSSEVVPKIECIDLNGSNRQPLVQLEKSNSPYGLALTKNHMFWTDWKKPQVHGAFKASGEKIKPLTHIFGHMGKSYGVRAVPNECPQATSACQSTSGICQMNELCLPNGHGGRSCVCFDGYESSSNGCTLIAGK